MKKTKVEMDSRFKHTAGYRQFIDALQTAYDLQHRVGGTLLQGTKELPEVGVPLTFLRGGASVTSDQAYLAPIWLADVVTWEESNLGAFYIQRVDSMDRKLPKRVRRLDIILGQALGRSCDLERVLIPETPVIQGLSIVPVAASHQFNCAYEAVVENLDPRTVHHAFFAEGSTFSGNKYEVNGTAQLLSLTQNGRNTRWTPLVLPFDHDFTMPDSRGHLVIAIYDAKKERVNALYHIRVLGMTPEEMSTITRPEVLNLEKTLKNFNYLPARVTGNGTIDHE